MSKKFLFLTSLAVLAVVSCVTINIYFPAEEVRNAADRIVNEVWGEKNQQKQETPTPPAQQQETPGPGSSLWHWIGPKNAYAAQNIDVSTPEIRAIKESIKNRAEKLFPYLDSGNIGIGSDGLLKLRSGDGLSLKARGEVTRLVAAENDDRERLYKEIARANGFPDQVAEVQTIFAESWRAQAHKGWYLEDAKGNWQKK